MPLKACSACGRIHSKTYKCPQSKRIEFKRDENVRARAGRPWHEKSLAIRERSGYLCAVCFKLGKLTYDDLEVHHITPVKDDDGLFFDDSNLICLCPACHEKAERGRISAAYLRELARERDERPDIPAGISL